MALYSVMEPLFPAQDGIDLEDLAFELVTASSSLAGQLNSTVSESVGDLVRSMNCYYSNLIEGHNTMPRDIERALAQDYSSNPQKRNLQVGSRRPYCSAREDRSRSGQPCDAHFDGILALAA